MNDIQNNVFIQLNMFNVKCYLEGTERLIVDA